MKVPDCPQVTRIGVKNITDGKHKNALTQLSALDQYARKHGISIICVDALYDEAGTPITRAAAKTIFFSFHSIKTATAIQ